MRRARSLWRKFLNWIDSINWKTYLCFFSLILLTISYNLLFIYVFQDFLIFFFKLLFFFGIVLLKFSLLFNDYYHGNWTLVGIMCIPFKVMIFYKTTRSFFLFLFGILLHKNELIAIGAFLNLYWLFWF